MAFSKCPHCEGTYFEMKEVEPQGANFKQTFIQCSTCGAPMGAVAYTNTAALLDNHMKEMKSIQLELSSMKRDLRQVLQAIQRS